MENLANQSTEQRTIAINKIIELIKTQDNFVFSPASLELAVALLAEGLEPEAFQAVSSKLGIDFSGSNNYARLKTIKTKLNQKVDNKQTHTKYSVVSSNSIWLD